MIREVIQSARKRRGFSRHGDNYHQQANVIDVHSVPHTVLRASLSSATAPQRAPELFITYIKSSLPPRLFFDLLHIIPVLVTRSENKYYICVNFPPNFFITTKKNFFCLLILFWPSHTACVTQFPDQAVNPGHSSETKNPSH